MTKERRYNIDGCKHRYIEYRERATMQGKQFLPLGNRRCRLVSHGNRSCSFPKRNHKDCPIAKDHPTRNRKTEQRKARK